MTDTTDLPSGTVTFLFTDIEGSTRLLRELGETYDEMLDLHHASLRTAWAAHRGSEVSTEGDSFFVAFADAGDAVSAAVDAQCRLAAAAWPTTLPVRVRMGLHTGYARPYLGDYRALAVNQAARVVAAANGGQIFMTQDVVDHLDSPCGHSVRSLGRYRVRDFDAPVLLYSVSASGMPDVDARPRVRPAEGHNIVRPTTQLVGRTDELARLRDLLADARFVTVAGPGGAGKTRLVTELAITLAPDWQDGVWFVDLSPVSSKDLVPAAIADALGLAVPAAVDVWRAVMDHLRERRALLVLDNCEQVIAGAAHVVVELLERCADVSVLATSRAPLGLRAESVFRLGGLAPADGIDPPIDPAVELFAARAGLTLNADETAVVGELCRELDDLPLAIELAAARAAAMAPRVILERLRQGRATLTSNDPSLPERHRSLDLTLEWSYQLLADDARALLRGLAVFAGSFDAIDAADAAAGVGIASDDVADLLWVLADSSLIQRDPADGERYQLLRSVRADARARAERVEAEAVAVAVAAGFLQRLGPQRAMDRNWLGAVRAELDNVRDVIAQLARAGGEIEGAQRLAWSVGYMHDTMDQYPAGVAEMTRFVDLLPQPTSERVGMLTMLTDLLLRSNLMDEAAPVLAEAQLLAERVGPPVWDDSALTRSLGHLSMRRGDSAHSAELARAALEHTRLDRPRARLYNMLGIALVDLGDVDAAADAFRAETEAARRAGMETFLVNSTSNLAETLLRLGDDAGAAAHQADVLEMARSMRQPTQIAFSMIVAAHLVSHESNWYDAVVLHSAADALIAATGIAMFDSDLEQSRRLVERARLALGDARFRAAVEAGQTASVDVATEAAAAHLHRVASGVPAPSSSS